MKTTKIRYIWRCKDCGYVQVSYSTIPHKMNTCKCGEASVDLEECYMRCSGNIETLAHQIFNEETREWEDTE